MSAHTDHPRDVGKFDCRFDEEIHTEIVMNGWCDEESGKVDAPTGWFGSVRLDPQCEWHPDDPADPGSTARVEVTCDGSCTKDAHLIEHYGDAWLIVREDFMGFFTVAAFESERARDERFAELAAAYERWDDGDE